MNADQPIERLLLPTRAYFVLLRARIESVEQVRSLSYEQLLKVRGLGPKLASEVISSLSTFSPAA